MQVNSNTTASICLLKIQFSDLNSHFRSADFKSSQYAKGRRSVRVRSCGYFIVYAAKFLRSAHGANFVAVLVHILGILDMIGAFALYPAKAGDIDHIRQFVIVSYWLRCRSRLRRMYRSGFCHEMSKTGGKNCPQTGKWELKEFRASQGRKSRSAVDPRA